MGRIAPANRARRVGIVGLGGEPRAERFELHPDLEELLDFSRRKPAHERPSMRRVFDQALGGQAPQRLAHRAAAHGEAHREVAFDEARSRRQPPRENVAPKPLDDMGDRRAMRGRRRFRGVDLGKRGRGLIHPLRLPEGVKLQRTTQIARGPTGIAIDASGGSAIVLQYREAGNRSLRGRRA